MKIYTITNPVEGMHEPTYDEVLLSGYTAGYESGYTDGKEECRDYSKEYFTIEALEDGDLIVRQDCQYSINEGPWTPITATTTLSLHEGEKVRFKGYLESVEDMFNSNRIRSIVYGNIESLGHGDDFIGKDTCLFAKGMLAGMRGLEDVSYLVLPATVLVMECYSNMFQNCRNIKTAPELPATTLALRCYYDMFWNCTSLISAPALPATTLAGGCYGGMFQGCTSLASAPELPAKTLDGSCYSRMFYGCTSLTKAPELPATTVHGTCYEYMFADCTSLTKAPELPATNLNDIPGWTLQYNYRGMFSGCTSLETAPELPATVLSNGCYENMFAGCTSLVNAPTLNAERLLPYSYDGMFSGCTNLEYVECMAKTNTITTTSTKNWLYGVKENGVFKRNSEYNWSRDASGIPVGWTVIEE